MHHTRKTHNAHNETQKRLKKKVVVSSTWYREPRVFSKDKNDPCLIGKSNDEKYFVESHHSDKWFKKNTSRRLRRREIDVNKINRKALQSVFDPW